MTAPLRALLLVLAFVGAFVGVSPARAALTRRPWLASEVTVLTVTSARLFKSPLAVTQTRHAGGLCQWCQGQVAAGRQAGPRLPGPGLGAQATQ